MANITQEYKIYQDGSTPIMQIAITLPDTEISKYSDYQWDSKTGAVTAKNINTGKRVLIPYTGTSTGTLKPESFSGDGVRSFEYDYWYY